MSDWQQPPNNPWDPAAGGQQQPGWGIPPHYPGYAPYDPTDPLVSRDYSGWWQRVFAILRAGWRPLLVLQLIVAAVYFVVQLPGHLMLNDASRAVSAESTDIPWGEFAAAAGVLMVGALLLIGLSALMTVASVRTVLLVATGRQVRVGEQLRASLRRLLPMIGWETLAAVIAIFALLACFLPVLYALAVFLILPAVVVFERGGAIGRCFELFHNDLGAAVARAATVGGLAVGASIVVAVLDFALTFAIDGVPGSDSTLGSGQSVPATVVSLGLNSLLTAAIGLLWAPFLVVTYADLRARREPVTTAQLAQQLDAT